MDALLGRLETTYDVPTRADLSRQYQEIIAEQQPALFVDHWRQLEATAKGLRTTDGPLDLNVPYVWAFPERLVLETSSGSWTSLRAPPAPGSVQHQRSGELLPEVELLPVVVVAGRAREDEETVVRPGIPRVACLVRVAEQLA